MADPMPPRHEVPALFDGHAERPWSALTPEERIDWLWATMSLLRAGRAAREALRAPRPR